MTNHQDRIYQLLHEALLEIKEQNNLNASIYTLFREDGNFYFGVNSESKAHFSYKYEHFPKELETNYKVGGSVDVYEDQNGYWLSDFAPISNSEGELIAVVQVYNRFDEFLAQAREEIFINSGIFLFFIFFLIRSMRSILVQEDQLNAELMQSKLEI